MLRLLTEQTFGGIIRTPSDFNMLMLDIRRRTGESISMSTLKRIWRYVNSDHNPSLAILSILSKYNGFANYEDFERNIVAADEQDSEFFIGKTLMSSSLNVGDEVSLRWGGCKECSLRVLGNERFEVIDSRNIKLKPGSRFVCPLFCQGRPFAALNVEHPDGHAPVYIAALKTGIDTIEVIRKDQKKK